MNSESIGFLVVEAKTANGALPVEGAKVSVYEYSQNGDDKGGALLYSVLTDQDGKTVELALDAKSKPLSMSPGNKNPFSVYNIIVEKEGYYDNSYINAPIFQGITSVQPVDLIPLLEYAKPNDDFPNTTRRFVETPNTEL